MVIQLVTAALLDFILGDPWGWPHPVQAIGRFISFYSQAAIGAQTRWQLRTGTMRLLGIGLACITIAGSAGVCALLLWALGALSSTLQQVGSVVLLASCFAGRSLRLSAEAVIAPLINSSRPDLPIARERLGMIVGRDTQQLEEKGIYRAVLETVSENAIDGVLAPLFYALLGATVGLAAPVAIAYKAVSTLDSMVGYKTAPYTHLGWFSARLEDALTWLPCRISVVAIALLSKRPVKVLSLCGRDAPQDPSPNAGWSECAYAAALGVQLGGENSYGGKQKFKPLLADAERSITAEVVREAYQITRWSFLWGLLLGGSGLWAIAFWQGYVEFAS